MKFAIGGLALACAAALAQDLTQTATALHSQTVTRHVEQLGARLALYLPAPRSAYSFEVVEDGTADNPTNEPRASMNGRISVRAVSILACRNEAEFAGVLAHAMAHVADGPAMGGTASNENLIPRSQVPADRSRQMEADRLAAQAMAQAGFDPGALLAYLARLQPAGAFREIRLDALQTAVRELPARNYESSPGSGFDQVQAEVRALTGNPVRQSPSLLRP